MPTFKNLLKKIEIQTAKRKRDCKRTHSKIKAGEKCLVVWDDAYKSNTYCKQVGMEMIQEARKKLNLYESEL